MFDNGKIRLDKADLTHVDIYHKWRNDCDIMAWTSPHIKQNSYEETERFFKERVISSYSFMIYSYTADKFVGITSLTNVDSKNRNAEFIIDIGEKDIWGQGIGLEAMNLVLKYAFFEMNLHRVFLRVFSFNERAINLYKKIGFKIEGEMRESLFRDGKWHSIVFMGLLKKEYIYEI